MAGKSHTQDFIIKRQAAVLKLHRKGMTSNQIVRKLPKKFNSPCKKTVDTDLANIRAGMLEYAKKLLGDQKSAVADFINKSLELRGLALRYGDVKTAHQIDKDLLKFVGVNIDQINVVFNFGDKDGNPTSFIEMINQIREEKQLTQVHEDEL